MAAGMMKDICGNSIGIQNECWGVGTKFGVRMMIVMLAASEMYA
jgi:hypothetical protein